MTTLRKAMPLILFCAALLVCLPLAAQTQDCSFTYTFTGDGTQAGQSNLSANTPCVNWRITLSTDAATGGTLSSTVTFQTSPDNSTWTAVPNTVCSSTVQPPCVLQGANPIVGTQGMLYTSVYGAYVRVVISGSSGTGHGTVRAYGIKGASAAALPPGGGGGVSAIACVGTPGNTTGAYLQQCQTTAGAVYACNNAAGCTVAADWVNVGAAGSGTVTTVGFTGGIISVATPTTTPALTVAGTSGGIPYFLSASSWASSGVLAANALVVGGGAGAAPSTPSATTTLDASGNLSTPGAISTGVGGSAAGALRLRQGTTPTAGTTEVVLYGASAITSYKMRLPAAAATGFVLGTNTAGDVVQTFVNLIPPANGGTGVANGTNNTITFTNNYTLGVTLTANTAVTFPISGTLCTTVVCAPIASPTFTTSATAPVFNATATTNQIVTGASSNLTTLNFPASSGAVTLTFPNTTATICTTVTCAPASGIALSALATQAADTVVMNATAGVAVPTAVVWPACAADGAHAITYPSHVPTCTAISGGSGPTTNQNIRVLPPVHFDGGGSALSGTQTRCFLEPVAGTIAAWQINGNPAGSATFSVKSATTTAYNTATGDTGFSGFTDVVNGGTAPSITTANYVAGANVTSWLTTVTANTMLCAQLTSPSGFLYVDLTITMAAN